jgi:hypothetical protein
VTLHGEEEGGQEEEEVRTPRPSGRSSDPGRTEEVNISMAKKKAAKKKKK